MVIWAAALVIVTSGQLTVIWIGPEVLLAWGVPSVVELTTAVFWMLGQSPGVVVRVTVRLKLANAAIEVAVQCRFCPLKGKQVRPLTTPDVVGPVRLQPVPGSVSVRSMPRAVFGPLLRTVMS